MARDVKHRIPAYRPKKRWGALQRVLLIVAMTSIPLTGLVFLLRSNPQPAPEQHEEQVEAPVSGTLFSYFRILEDRETAIPESQINEEQRNARLGKSPKEGAFSLLIGTYKSKKEADAIKTKLTSIDSLMPRMEEVTLEFASWYRLKLGPYRTLRDANKVRLFLREQGIDSILETENPR